MTERPKDEGSVSLFEAPAEFGFFRQLSHMVVAGWATPERRLLVLLAVCLVTVVGTTAYMQILLNAWNEPFYDAIARKDLPGFLKQLQVFAMLAGLLLALNVGQLWLNQTMKLTMRRGLVTDLLNVWLRPGRPFRLTNAGPIGHNPDQRLQADALHLADLSIDLGVGLLQASLLLSAFIGVLWAHSEGLSLEFGGQAWSIPGFMVWCALLYASIASWLSWRVGRPMIALDAERYSREGEYRFELVRISENAGGVALMAGEARERSRVDAVFSTVIAITRRQIRAMTRLAWVTSGYGWFTIVAPILAASPFYFRGDMTMGGLMLVVGAFNQVQGSLRWFVDNFAAIADWRATLLRVSTFRRVLVGLDADEAEDERIDYRRHGGTALRIDAAGVTSPIAGIALSDARIEAEPGERIRIGGDYGAGKTLFFLALAGMWQRGRGRIELPAGDAVMFLPAQAYVTPGRLRDCITYPGGGAARDDAAMRAALAMAGLGHLSLDLDAERRWDRVLNDSEKQCLAIARAILRQPRWLIMEDVFHVMDPAARRLVLDLFDGPLKSMGVVYMGGGAGEEGFFTREVLLLPDATPLQPPPEPVSPRSVEDRPASQETLRPLADMAN